MNYYIKSLSNYKIVKNITMSYLNEPENIDQFRKIVNILCNQTDISKENFLKIIRENFDDRVKEEILRRIHEHFSNTVDISKLEYIANIDLDISYEEAHKSLLRS